MPFYTEHPGFSRYITQARWAMPGGSSFHDPENTGLQDQLWAAVRSEYLTHAEWMPPAYLAHRWQLPSSNAAAYAVMQGAGRSSTVHARHAVSFYEDCSTSTSEDEYEPPEDPSEDEMHLHPWCQCDGCQTCDCRECSCDRCNPDSDRCDDRDCSWCHEDCDTDCYTCHGDGCECSSCYDGDDESCNYDTGNNSYDDQDDDDSFAGRVVEAPPGRCRFGIEVEFNAGDRSYIAQQLVQSGIACSTREYTHEIVPYWKMTTDSTVSGGEIVSPIMRGDDYSIEEVREVLRVVKANGGYTGSNVGMHVHLDVTPFHTPELQALAHNLQASEKLFAGFVPKHRYNGSNGNGAQLMHERQWEAIATWVTEIDPSHRQRSVHNRSGSCPVSRSVSFNFNALLTYGTVECRLLGHTLNTIKVRTWIRALQSVIEASAREAFMPTCDGLAWLAQFGLEAEYASHFREVVVSRGNEEWLVCAA